MSDFKMGDIVLIRKGDPNIAAKKSWAPSMDQYDGQTTTIVQPGSSWSTLNIDRGLYLWHNSFLTLVGEVITRHTTTTAKSDGCKCSKCGEFVPYVEKSSSFVCYTCKHR